jgi:uncharacterized protein (DUF1778 family)
MSKSRPKPKTRPPSKVSKIHLRVRADQKNLLAQAAHVRNTTLTQFILETALTAAQQVLADQAHFTLSPEAWEEFCKKLDEPPRVIPALRELLTKPSILDGGGRPTP